MYWHSFADFLAMGRHGVYVWGAFAVMALAMTLEPWLLVRARRRLLARLRRQRPPGVQAGRPAAPARGGPHEAAGAVRGERP